MSNLTIKSWYETNKETLITSFMKKAELFQHYKAMSQETLRNLMEREWHGSCSIMSADEAELARAVEQAREQFREMELIPMDEQTAFLTERVKILHNLLDADPMAASFREQFSRREQQAILYYNSVVSSLTAQIRMERISKQHKASQADKNA